MKTISNKKILVTGGAGFIGSHLIEKLHEDLNSVISLDNYLTGSSENHIAGVEYVTGDAGDISQLFNGEKFDYLFHLGEYSRVEQSMLEPNVALSNSYRTFAAILDFWRKSGSKLIYSGSSTKFAKNIDGLSLSPYTAAKALNSQLLLNYANWYSLPHSIVYFYNVYGGRELSDGNYSTVVGKFKKMVSEGCTSLPVRGPGTQRRNFTHVNDIVSGIILAAVRGEGDGYGIGAMESISIIELCKMLRCEPQILPPASSNRQDGHLYNQKIIELGWKQEHTLYEEIDQFLESL